LVAAISVRMTMPRLYRRFARYSGGPMPTSSELKQRIEEALPGARVAVEDLTGGGDHFRAEIESDRFAGLSRIQQHKLVYDVFGAEIGGPIHALSIKTSTPGGVA
jgi:stress-induced morphogen